MQDAIKLELTTGKNTFINMNPLFTVEKFLN